MEDNVFENPDLAAHQGNRFLETLIDQVFEEESINKPKTTLHKQIDKLYEFGVLDSKNLRLFDSARHQRNNSIHNDPSIESSLKLNRYLFDIAVWFYNKYSFDDNFQKFKYVEPSANSKKENLDESIASKVNAYLEDMLSNSLKRKDVVNDESIQNFEGTTIKEEDSKNVGNKKDILNKELEKIVEDKPDDFSYLDYEFNQSNGSYLINELNKLNMSSKQAIADSNGLDYFKQYIHVDRDIQHTLHRKLVEVENKEGSHIIMLTGSVGDGKSHLLSYMKSNYPELMGKFSIHNDATESFDPNLTAIETLLDVLEPFNDKNINFNSEKLILAINLGILNNLLDDDKFKHEFTKLKELLEENNVFNSDNLDELNSPILSVINFSDYQLYELNEEGPSSTFLEDLFSKITFKSLENPFYNAYNKDLENDVYNPVIINYEMLMNETVTEKIIQILIKYIIKNKKLISTRELLNFIYEILVPSDVVNNFNKGDVTDYIDGLLPILLFNSKNRSKILKEISGDTPINIRHYLTDKFLISLNTSPIDVVIDDYFGNYSEIDFFKEYLIHNFVSLPNSDKKLIKEKLIYFLLFFGNDKIKEAFIDSNYEEFVTYLYYYNYKPKKLKKFFTKVKNSILRWKGMLKKDVILIDELHNFKIGNSFDIDFKRTEPITNTTRNKFKTYIQFNVLYGGNECFNECSSYCNLNNCVKLEIDYHLCESIIKISNGYQPNKIEKQNLVVFDDFIGSLLSKININQLLIENKRSKKIFKFKKSSGEYSFEEG